MPTAIEELRSGSILIRTWQERSPIQKRRPPFRNADEPTLNTLLYTKHIDWHYETEVRVFARLEERDRATGLYFGDFNEHLVLREVITGPLCTTEKGEIEAALNDKSVAVIKGRLAFNTFNVVRNKNGFGYEATRRLR